MTDRDILATLCCGGFGWTGFTPAIYESLSDRQIIDVLFAERDDDGKVIPESVLAGEAGGSLANAARELPSQEELDVPDEAFAMGAHVSYVLMFWQVWRSRGVTSEATLEKFKEVLKKNPPRGM